MAPGIISASTAHGGEPVYCCLCVCPLADINHKEVQHLHDEEGASTEAYAITAKYFDPMLLIAYPHCDLESTLNYNPTLGVSKSKILCGSCWQHISNFHDFQQNIIKKQRELQTQWNRIKIERNEEIFILSGGTILDGMMKNEINCVAGENQSDCKKTLEIEEKLETKSNEDVDCNFQMKKDFDGNSTTLLTCKKMPKNNSKLMKKQQSDARRKTLATRMKSTIRRTSTHYNSMEKTRELDAFIAELRPQLECDLCNLQLVDFNSLRDHFNCVHQERCYLKCCERKFYRRCIYVEHLRLHLNPDLYKCDICGRKSTSKHNLILHKQVVHSATKGQHECKVCNRRFNQKGTLTRHMVVHATGNKDNICPECGKGYVLSVQLKTHMKTAHSVDRICDQCGKTVHGVSALRQHLREHAGIKKPKWPCEICGSELISRNSLNRHKLSYHHDGSTVYVCKECGKTAASENALLLHKKHVHEAERKFKCTYCQKAFKKNKVLQEHIATHTGQDLYQCPHCPQTFKVSANLHHHRKKAHPIQWAEARQHRRQVPKVNLNAITKEIIL